MVRMDPKSRTVSTMEDTARGLTRSIFRNTEGLEDRRTKNRLV